MPLGFCFWGQMVRQGCWRLASSSHPIQPDRASEWPNWRCVREEGDGRTGGGSVALELGIGSRNRVGFD